MTDAPACRDCRHSFRSGAGLICRALPPTPAPEMGRKISGEIGIVSWSSAFPPVLPDWWCGMFGAVDKATH